MILALPIEDVIEPWLSGWNIHPAPADELRQDNPRRVTELPEATQEQT